MIDMINKDILPAVYKFMGDLSQLIVNKKQISETLICESEKSVLEKLSILSSALHENNHKLYSVLKERTVRYAIPNREDNDWEKEGRYYRDVVFEQMEKTRAIADEIESLVGESYWPYPTYGKLLFSVR